MKNFNYFWFDVETTGLHYYNNNILSLAYLIELNGKVVDHGTFYAKPEDMSTIESKALQINGFTIDQILKFESQYVLYCNIVKLLKKYDIKNKEDRFITAGYNNAGCDNIFLQQLFNRYSKSVYEYWDYFKSIKLDVFTLFPIIEELTGIQFKSHRLEDIAPIFKIEHKAHEAMSDIIVTYKLFKIFMQKIYEGKK
jgi:DNA polymerase III alpha subunit (gram-positive type)